MTHSAFVLTPTGLDTALELIKGTGEWSDQDGATHKSVYRWIRALYPPTENAPWGLLQPDRLLEYFLGQRLTHDPLLVDAHVEGISEAEAVRLVTLYSRAAAHPALAGLEEHLIALCTRHLDSLGPAIIDAATQVEHPTPLIQALDDAVASPETTLEVLEGLYDALPLFSQRLASFAEHASTRLVHEHQERAGQDPDAYLPDLATSLNNQSIRLGALGRAEEALQAITQAVQIRRTLAEHRPDAYLPDLAASLNNQSIDLGALGRVEEALQAITQAAQIRRTLAEHRPDAYLPDLAASLNNQSIDLGALGRTEEALQAITQAVDHYRTLAEHRPDTYLPDLAASLNNQSIHLGALGRVEEALQAITQAVQIRRGLAGKRPAVHQQQLEASLQLLKDFQERQADKT